MYVVEVHTNHTTGEWKASRRIKQASDAIQVKEGKTGNFLTRQGNVGEDILTELSLLNHHSDQPVYCIRSQTEKVQNTKHRRPSADTLRKTDSLEGPGTVDPSQLQVQAQLLGLDQ